MDKTRIDRRAFLGAAGGAAVLPYLLDRVGEDDVPPARIAIIGVGSRGTGLLKILLKLPEIEVPAICDIDEDHLNRSLEIVRMVRGDTPAGFSRDEYDYRRMLERDDFDAVLIATPARWHALMAVDAMNAGKHVGSEVPGAYTLEGCLDLVRIKKKTGRRYMLLENYCYSRHRMMVLNMARAGLFGETYYAECAYIHDCSRLRFNPDGTLTWRGESKRDHIGNLYPTHSLGPVSKWMGIHRGDRMVSLTSSMSKSASLPAYTAERFGPESAAAKIDWQCGDMCVTLIKTALDRLITVYYDTDSPRPMSIFYLIQGTEGVYDSRQGIHIEGRSPSEHWENAEDYLAEYDHPYWRDRGGEAMKTGHGGGDYFVLSDFVEMVRQDREPFVDVYDSAAWSSIMPLSAESIRRGSAGVEIPDFTGGRWKGND